MSRRTGLWVLSAAILVSQFGVQSAWAGRRRRCAEPAPTVAARPGEPAPRTNSSAATPPGPAQADAPFQLTAEQQAYVDAVLTAWEKQSAKVTTFSASFSRWDYSEQSLLPEKLRETAHTISEGKLACGRVNQWIFKTTDVRRLNEVTETHKRDRDAAVDVWMRDGRSYAEYNERLKQVTEHVAPRRFLGTIWIDNLFPWPLLCGIKAQKLKERYYIRIITPEEHQMDEVWIDVFPRLTKDAFFKRIILKLQRDSYEALAMRVYSPASDYCSFQFDDRAKNIPFERLRNQWMPQPPLCTWKKIVEPEPSAK